MSRKIYIDEPLFFERLRTAFEKGSGEGKTTQVVSNVAGLGTGTINGWRAKKRTGIEPRVFGLFRALHFLGKHSDPVFEALGVVPAKQGTLDLKQAADMLQNAPYSELANAGVKIPDLVLAIFTGTDKDTHAAAIHHEVVALQNGLRSLVQPGELSKWGSPNEQPPGSSGATGGRSKELESHGREYEKVKRPPIRKKRKRRKGGEA